MKIAAYNIMSGGFSSYSPTTDTPERLALIQKAVQNINADFIGLIDTFRWKDLYTEVDLQKMFGYRYAFHIDMDDVRVDKKIGIAVLTNISGVKFTPVRLKLRNCIKAEVPLQNKAVDIYTAYLDDLSEATREIQMQALINDLRPRPTIVMGDLNCIVKEDVKLLKDHGTALFSTNKSFIPVFREMCKARVLAQLRAKGFTEALAPGSPQGTALTKLHPFNIENPIFRVDHIFHTKDIKSTNFKVWSDISLEYTSDHYPISCTIALKT